MNLIRVMPAKGQDVSMQKSLTIARLVGPVLAAIGIGMLANQATYREIATQFLGGHRQRDHRPCRLLHRCRNILIAPAGFVA